jgi:integrase
MNALRQALGDYLTIRRNLGFELRLPAKLLERFVTFAEAEHAPYITTELALRWAQQPADAQPSTWASRLGMVRRFAVWYSATEPHTQVPPEGLLAHRYRRKPPYIYTDGEIEGLIQAARELPSSRGLRAHTYSTLFGLLAVTGMRINEALNLDREDIDLVEGILTIRRTKFGKTRLVPVHASSQEALNTYAETRDRILSGLKASAFFVSERSTRITEWSARYTFAKVSQKIGLREIVNGHGRGPRLHDMRHRFAARTLVDWYRAGIDVEREIPKLATYLGHVHVNDTYWYIEAVPELLQLATERLVERRRESRS